MKYPWTGFDMIETKPRGISVTYNRKKYLAFAMSYKKDILVLMNERTEDKLLLNKDGQVIPDGSFLFHDESVGGVMFPIYSDDYMCTMDATSLIFLINGNPTAYPLKDVYIQAFEMEQQEEEKEKKKKKNIVEEVKQSLSEGVDDDDQYHFYTSITGYIDPNNAYIIVDDIAMLAPVVDGKIGEFKYIKGKSELKGYYPKLYSPMGLLLLDQYTDHDNVLIKDFEGDVVYTIPVEKLKYGVEDAMSWETSTGFKIVTTYDVTNANYIKVRYNYVDMDIPDQQMLSVVPLYFDHVKFPPDLTIMCGDGTPMHVHRFVLILQSKFADESLTNSHFAEVKELESEFSFDVVNLAVQLMYNVPDVTIPPELLIPLFVFADQWMSPTVFNAVLTEIKKNHRPFIEHALEYTGPIPPHIATFIETLYQQSA